MKVTCSCKKKAVIGKIDGSRFYCSCSDPLCGHSFLVEQTFKHSIENKHPNHIVYDGSKIYCGCGQLAIAYSNNKLTDKVSDIYHRCEGCGHRFVMTRAFVGSINPGITFQI